MNISCSSSIALIGCGDWGTNIARTLKKMNVLGGIVDHTEKAQRIALELHSPLLTFESVLKDPSIKGVVIATPTPTHFPLAEQALLHGKSVLVEKPMASSVEEIESLAKVARQKELILMVGHLLMYHKAFQGLVSLVQSGKLGQILNIETSRKNFGKIHNHEGVLWDLGPHDFSMILSILGKLPISLISQSSNYIYQGKQDIQDILMMYEDNLSVRISLSRLHPVKEQTVVVVGTKGAAIFDDTKEWKEKLRVSSYEILPGSSLIKRDMMEPMEIEPAEPLKEELAHFIECIINRTTPLSSVKQAQQVFSLIKASEDSEKTKKWIQLDSYNSLS